MCCCFIQVLFCLSGQKCAIYYYCYDNNGMITEVSVVFDTMIMLLLASVHTVCDC